MKFGDLLFNHKAKMSKELADILEPAIKEVFPLYYERCKFQKWSNYRIVNYMSNLELDEKDLIKLINIANRYSKIWIFS